jgi:hypothetical protein
MWILGNKKKREGFSYISPERLNKDAIVVFVVEFVVLLILIAGAIFALSYFHIFSFSTIHIPTISILNNNKKISATDPKKAPDVTPQAKDKENKVVIITKDEVKVKTLEFQTGYTILWMVPNDTIGRTILYENNRNTTAQQLLGGRLNGVGQVRTDGDTKVTYIVGSFVKTEKINNSKDLNLILRNPLTNKNLSPIRLSYEQPKTRLYVEDDAYGPLKPIPDYKSEGEVLGLLSDYINKPQLLKVDDAVAVLLNQEELSLNKYVATTIVLRRFGGKLELEKEL